MKINYSTASEQFLTEGITPSGILKGALVWGGYKLLTSSKKRTRRLLNIARRAKKSIKGKEW